jgi:YidC/Oxa1 family membrane protein insertase
MLRADLKVDMCPGIEQFATAKGTSVANVTCSQFADSAYAASHHINVTDPSFLFIPDLTAKATGAVLVVLIALYVGSQIASGLLSSASMDRNQRMIMLGLPILFVAFIINFPAGLMVYWITTNCWTIVQQLIVRRVVGVPSRPALAPAGAAPAGAAALTRGGGRTRGTKSAAPKSSAKESTNGATGGPPPQSPRRKKKRTGRRR